MTKLDLTEKQQQAAAWFRALRDQICAQFEALEQAADNTQLGGRPAGSFQRKTWQRDGGGGGEMSIMHGRVFEKVGVNISVVHGQFAPEFRKQIPGTNEAGDFWAAGISLVAHMQNPHVPAAHMNTRMITTGKSWFGGGGDLTPMYDMPEAANSFHDGLKAACDRHNESYYPEYKKWCDEYFYLPHRDEPRGAGGIFYDQLDSGDWAADFDFTKDVGTSFADTYGKIVKRYMAKPWDDADRENQLIKRGRYVEFNLLHDRGTLFGLKTGGNIEAILMSMPPEARWP